MTEINDKLECCGIGEIINIIDAENSEQIIKDCCKEMYENEKMSAFLLFSDIQYKKAGRNLSKYILKHQLGTITHCPTTINSNSGNSLKLWIWTINKRNLRNYHNKHNKRNIYD